MIPERTNDSALALIGPYSAGRKARPQRRQLQPGIDCLHLDSDGCIIIDPIGPARLVDTTQRCLWRRLVRGITKAMWNHTQAAKPPEKALLVTREAVSTPHEHVGSGPQATARAGQRWSNVSILMAFVALFALGMAVEHRAEIINWKILHLALDGRAPARPPTPAPGFAGSKAPAPTPAVVVTSPAMPARPGASATATPETSVAVVPSPAIVPPAIPVPGRPSH